jgi:hypothetical protein
VIATIALDAGIAVAAGATAFILIDSIVGTGRLFSRWRGRGKR